MKVLVISQYFWPESFRINELVTALHSKGVEVEVLTGKPNYPSGQVFEGYRAWGCVTELLAGIPVHRVPLIPRGKGSANLGFNYLSFVVSAWLFGSWMLRNRSFDAIFVFAPSPIFQAIPAIWLGRLKNCPVLLWVQDLWPESITATGHRLHPVVLKTIEYIVKMIYRRVDFLLAQSRDFISRMKPLSGGTPIAYYPNSFLESALGETPKAVTCEGFECDFAVLFAGNLGAAQAVEAILEAATILRNVDSVHFIMVGQGSRREWMIKQAEERGLSNMFFPGSFPVETMPDLMNRASALLVTLADTEIFRLTIPSKIQAYMAAGRPIIASLNGAGADIVKEAGAGIVVPAEDGAGLAQAVRAMLEMSAIERLEMGAKGRVYFEENFALEKLVGELIEHLEQSASLHRGKKL